MQPEFPQAFFSSPGMIVLLVVLVTIEIASLGFFWLAAYEYRKMAGRHEAFFRAMEKDEEHTKVERAPRLIFLIYVILTIVFTVLTSVIFLWRPHLF